MSQFILKADPLHWMVVKHIMRYLKGTLIFKLYFKEKDITLRDWVGDTNG
jgi:hypothetical protein